MGVPVHRDHHGPASPDLPNCSTPHRRSTPSSGRGACRCAEISGAESREKKKQRAAHEDGPRRDVNAARSARAPVGVSCAGCANVGAHRALSAPPHLHAQNAGHSEQQKDEEENQERGIDDEIAAPPESRRRPRMARKRRRGRWWRCTSAPASRSSRKYTAPGASQSERSTRWRRTCARRKEYRRENDEVRDHEHRGDAMRQLNRVPPRPANPL